MKFSSSNCGMTKIVTSKLIFAPNSEVVICFRTNIRRFYVTCVPCECMLFIINYFISYTCIIWIYDVSNIINIGCTLYVAYSSDAFSIPCNGFNMLASNISSYYFENIKLLKPNEIKY